MNLEVQVLANQDQGQVTALEVVQDPGQDRDLLILLMDLKILLTQVRVTNQTQRKE